MNAELPAVVSVLQEPGDQLRLSEELQSLDLQQRPQWVKTTNHNQRPEILIQLVASSKVQKTFYQTLAWPTQRGPAGTRTGFSLILQFREKDDIINSMSRDKRKSSAFLDASGWNGVNAFLKWRPQKVILFVTDVSPNAYSRSELLQEDAAGNVSQSGIEEFAV